MMKTPNEKALTAGTDKASGKRNQNRKYMGKGASPQDQRARILAALRSGPRTSYELRRHPVGSYQAPARIFELRAMGYDIVTHRTVVVDQDGYRHPQAARYELIEVADVSTPSTAPENAPCGGSAVSAGCA